MKIHFNIIGIPGRTLKSNMDDAEQNEGKRNCLLEAMPFEHAEESSVFFLYSLFFYPGHIFSSLSKYCIMHESITTIFKETARYD